MKTGRPKKSWLEGMVTAMKNRGLTFQDAQDRQLWKMEQEGGSVLYNPNYIYTNYILRGMQDINNWFCLRIRSYIHLFSLS
jgi:hypothetical protein